MAELANRQSSERDFMGELSPLSDHERAIIASYLGDPPDPRNVPVDVWQQTERERRDRIAAMLLMLFLLSAEQHGAAGDAMQAAGVAWAQQRAATVASGYVDNSRTMLANAGQRWRDIDAERRRAVHEAMQRGESIAESDLPSFSVDNDLEAIFGDVRDETIAITETSYAQTAGSEAAVAQTVGLDETDLWQCEDGACALCSPMHMKPRSYWDSYYPDGPGSVHPRCRCILVYAFESTGAEVHA